MNPLQKITQAPQTTGPSPLPPTLLFHTQPSSEGEEGREGRGTAGEAGCGPWIQLAGRNLWLPPQ